MTCPPGCARPESEALMKEQKSRYFVGISTPVIFVASLSFAAFLAVVFGAVFVSAIQTLFFFVLPLSSAAAGAFLVASPELTPLGDDATVRLLARIVGAVAIAYAGGALLVGRSSCAKTRTMHLTLVAAALGAMTAAFVVDEGAALSEEMSQRAASMLGKLTAAAAVGAVSTSLGPHVKKTIESGKPSGPYACCD